MTNGELTSLNAEFAAALGTWMPRGDRYLLAVSGGRDSMAMWHYLASNGYPRLEIGHMNHCLRGAESDEDEAFLQREAKSRGVRLWTARVDVATVASTEKKSIELAAREQRYRWLAELAEELDCRNIVTAHHADDQVETVLINLFRGSGPRGISGMDPRSARTVEGTSLELYRPFLTVPREEIDRYVGEHAIAFREDESNAEPFALRNRVRHRLLPLANEIFGRDVRGAVLRASELARLDDEALSILPEDSGIPLDTRLDTAELRALPEARRHRVLLEWLRKSGVPDCGFREVRRAEAVALSNDRPAKASLPGGCHVRRKDKQLFLEFPEETSPRIP